MSENEPENTKTPSQEYNENMDRKERLKREQERKRKTKNANQWDPDPGDTVSGKIFGVRKDEHSKYGVFYITYLKDDDGEIWGLPTMHSVLQNELSSVDAKIGTYVMVTYEGEKESSTEGNNDYKDYTVVADTETSDSEQPAPFING